MAGNLITSLLSLATNLLPSIRASAHAPASSSSNSDNSERERARVAEQDLERLMRTLERIKATLYDAGEREIRDRSVKLWLKELKKVAYDAEDVFGEYRYEFARVQLEARKASEASGSHKRKKMEYIVPIPDSMVDRLNKIRSRFDEIAKDREALQLRESDGARHPNNKLLRPPTDHMVDEARIFGRDAEIKEVINLLLSVKEKPFSVISIIGKGGLGKTTIAQLVYKDERVIWFFDLCGWVCVSEEFDVGRLTKATIESVSKINNNLSELSSLQGKLAETVKGKTILLVLDDLWNENQSLWELFWVPFKEAKLVRILITTRNKKVAKVMQTTAYFSPTNLPEDSCWQLFQHYAFRGTSDTMPPHLVNMGKDIMRKCGGLPLAVKSIASLLRHENEEGWREILESDLWESNPTNDIFPALQISYAHLPAHLKPCFLFCSLYPKDYLLEKMNLIELWISHGYIESKGKRRITEIGGEYYKELKERSILDDFSSQSSERCKLHDLMHDLARINSENEHYSVEIDQPLDIQKENVPREVYHLYARAKDREALQLRESDGVRCFNNKILQPPTGHMVDKTKFFGRDADITEVINYLLSEKKKSFSVISIVGKGGLGKTTIAQLVYKDGRVTRCFDLFGWVCVSTEFDVRRLIKSTIESVSKTNCGVSELSPLQEELAKTVKGKTVLLVLDDVWNDNQSLWELFQAPFKEAKEVRILVTTRSKKVADVMLTTTLFRPSNLPESSCWQLFQHYAFSDTSDTVPTHLVDMGREIMRKCGGLPLAVKLIASLLRHENEESWREILDSDLWESNPTNDIFPALQISYAHLPAHLKPCFLFCSLYPKDHLLEKINLIELWISLGYIESKGKRRITEIGGEYYKELKERSILDDFSSQSSECCKLHDLMHDLARINSENEHYSVEIDQPLDIQNKNVPREVYHLYARGFLGYVNQMLQQNQQNLMGLRTLSMDLRGCSSELEHQYCIKNTEAVDLNLKQSENYEECYGEVAICNLIVFEALTVLELKGYNLTKIPDSISQLKRLAYLCITSSRLKMLPLSVGLLYNLQTLILDCFSLEYLPESIGYLANLQFLYIQSGRVKKLPKSLCSLSNLLRLVIRSDDLEEVPLDIKNLHNLHALTIRSNQIQALPNTIGCLNSLEELNLLSLGGSYDDLPDGKLDYVPHGFVNFPAIKTMAAWLGVRTINWLKDMKELEGKLSIGGLKNISNLEDAQHANMRNKCKLETLDLCWDPGYYISPYDVKSELRLSIIPEACEGGLVGADDAVSFSLLECLQPHPNLKKLLVRWYPSATVPNWMKDPSSFWSIQEVLLECCVNIQSLPFDNFHTLKHLTIVACSRIRVLQLEQLSSQLEKLQIVSCDSLELITGLGDLDMLAALEIYSCQSLKSLTMEELQLVKSTEPFDDSFKKSHVGLLDMLEELQLVKSTEPFNDSSHEKSNIGWQKISSLQKLEIENCYSLPFLPDGLIPPGPCYVCVRGCGFPDLERNLTSATNEISSSSNLWRWR